MKKYLGVLHQKKIFTLNDVVGLTNNVNSAKDLLQNYKKQNLIIQIRRNLYSVCDLATGVTVANKFEIASNISSSSYISYRSAFEYYGIAHQIYYDIYISSCSRFNSFDFENIQYFYSKSIIDLGVETPSMDSLVRVTNLERTIVDCIDRIDRAGGIEELVHCLSLIGYLNENKLLEYLAAYNKSILYKKVGFVLEPFKEKLKLSNDFIELCAQNGKKHIGYLTDKNESNFFHNSWNIYAPKNILSYLEQGDNELV